MRVDTLAKLLLYRTQMPGTVARYYECLNSSKPSISQVRMIEPSIVRDHLISLLSRTRYWNPRFTGLAKTRHGPGLLEKVLKERALDQKFLKDVERGLIPFMSQMRADHHKYGYP